MKSQVPSRKKYSFITDVNTYSYFITLSNIITIKMIIIIVITIIISVVKILYQGPVILRISLRIYTCDKNIHLLSTIISIIITINDHFIVKLLYWLSLLEILLISLQIHRLQTTLAATIFIFLLEKSIHLLLLLLLSHPSIIISTGLF